MINLSQNLLPYRQNFFQNNTQTFYQVGTSVESCFNKVIEGVTQCGLNISSGANMLWEEIQSWYIPDIQDNQEILWMDFLREKGHPIEEAIENCVNKFLQGLYDEEYGNEHTSRSLIILGVASGIGILMGLGILAYCLRAKKRQDIELPLINEEKSTKKNRGC